MSISCPLHNSAVNADGFSFAFAARYGGVSRHSGVYPLSKAPAGENDL